MGDVIDKGIKPEEFRLYSQVEIDARMETPGDAIDRGIKSGKIEPGENPFHALQAVCDHIRIIQERPILFQGWEKKDQGHSDKEKIK